MKKPKPKRNPRHCYKSYGPNDSTCQKPYGHEHKCGPQQHKDALVMTTPGSIEILIGERETLRSALHDLLRFYDILAGHVGEHGVGWTYADIKRLEEIRALVTGNR